MLTKSFHTNKTANLTILLIIILITVIKICNGHGRLIEPPSRASAWRYGFQTPPNYNDHELYCGGFTRQWNRNGGKCGECGDPWDTPMPRPHEYGGQWGQGVIVRKYVPESIITLRVELTASHMGYFEFRICPNVKAKQDCLDENIVKILGGIPIVPRPSDIDTRFYPRNGSRIYEIKGQLPKDLKCDQCVLQWRYIAGNNWGKCDDGTGAVGCGPQEEFRACADISIGGTGRTTMRPFRPVTKPTTKSDISTTPADKEEPVPGTSDETTNSDRYIAILIAFLALLLVICLLATIYLYSYHGQRVKQILSWNRDKENTTASNVEKKSDTTTEMMMPPPVPPVRTKRLSLVKKIEPNEPSVISGQTHPMSVA